MKESMLSKKRRVRKLRNSLDKIEREREKEKEKEQQIQIQREKENGSHYSENMDCNELFRNSKKTRPEE